MRFSYSYRTARSVSPDKLETGWDSTTVSQHVNNIIKCSRANSEVRYLRPAIQSVQTYIKMRSLGDGGAGLVTDLRYASLLCNPHSPWSKTGAFYWPRYPEAWRGTAS